MKEPRQEAYETLAQLSSSRGYVTYDDIMNCADNFALSLPDVDWLSGSLATAGILIYDKAPTTTEPDNDEYDDFAQSDYEIIYGKIEQLSPALAPFVDAVRRTQPPQRGEINQLKYLVVEGNEYARSRMIEMNLRVALRVALQRAEAFDMDIEDAVGEACIGLITAVDKYNPDTSGAFASYAAMWIYQNISRNQPTQRPLVYYPVHRKEPYYTMYPVLKRYGCMGCEDLPKCTKARQMVRSELGLDEEAVEFVIAQMIPDCLTDISFLENAITNECRDVEDCFCELLKVRPEALWDSENCEETIIQKTITATIEEVLEALNPRERLVIQERFGLNGDDEKTLEQVGELFGVTRERIRQIEAKALRKLRHPSRSKKLRDFY